MSASPNAMSASPNAMWASQNAMPASRNAMPTSRNAMSTSRNAMSTSRNAMPTSQNAMPTSPNRMQRQKKSCFNAKNVKTARYTEGGAAYFNGTIGGVVGVVAVLVPRSIRFNLSKVNWATLLPLLTFVLTLTS